MFELMPKAVNAKMLERSRQPGCESELPVFILGMPRSGTSLMEQILSSHPDVFGAGELKFMTGVVDNILFGNHRIKLNDAEAVFPYEQNAPCQVRGQRYVDRIAELAPTASKRNVHTMPGNFTLHGLLPAILPHARLTHNRPP